MKKGGDKCFQLFVFIIFVIFLNLTLVRQVFCYDSNVAHPGIADLAVKQYNQNNSQKISVEQLGWIKTGAVEEDQPTRWLNHFYDPLYNRGLFFGTQNDSAKVWAKDYGKQTNFSLGDNSWQRAVNDFRKGNKELAFKELGHNIHLVSDMLVPAHTRDSIHAIPPDSYESYVKNNWSTVSKNIKSEVVNKSSLEDIFNDAAKYSNGNFYSDKTIENGKYSVHKISKLDPYNFNNVVDLYIASTKDSNGNLIKSHLTGGTDWKEDKKTVNNSAILQDYASHLLPKAISYSANTIKLFLSDVQKNETEKLPFFRISLGGLINTGVGEVISVAENIYDSANSQTPNDQIASGENTNNPVSDDIPNTPPNTQPVTTPVQSPILPAPTTPINNPITPNQPPENHTGGGGGGGGSSPIIIPVVNPVVIVVQTPTPTTTATDTTSSTTPVVTSTIDIPTTTIEIPTSTIPTSTPITPTTTPIETPTSTIPDTTPTSTIPTSTTPTSTTPTSTPDPVPPAPDVVINEIAWAGTSSATDQDEFIELYNNTDQDINLFSATNTSKWWKLMIGDKEISIGKIVTRVIPKNGYYLFERTDDRTVNEIPADIIYSGALKNTGERLRLLDGNNQLVDEVDCSSTWFAGSAVTYSSMEKINSRLPGNNSTNWQTNQGPRFVGKVDGGGDDLPLNGSPKQSNFGSIVLKSRQVETDRTLKKSDYPYILTYYEIPIGKTLNIDPGVVIKTYYADSKIDVKGNLNINGTSDSRVVMTSGRDVNFEAEGHQIIIGTRSGNAAAKDWQGLLLYASSTANLSGLDMRYAGKAFKAPGANTYDPFVSQTVRGVSAVLNINNSTFSDSGDTNIYLSKTTSTIKNTDFKNGVLAIENYDGSLELENIGLNNFTNINGPIYVKNIWPKMSQINFSNNTANNVAVDQAVISSDLTVEKDIPMTWQNITVEPSVTLNVSAGTNIKMPEYSNILVKGVLNLNGTENEPVNISAIQPLILNYWGRIIFDGGSGDFKNANISGGRGTIWNDGYQGMVTVKNGKLDMQNCQLLDSKPSGNTLEINNSNVNIKNSSIGYIGSKPNVVNTNGIKIFSGELTLDNTNLMNLDTGILSGSVDPLPTLHLNNMDARNFMNVKTFWDPILWFPGFLTSVTST